MKTMVSLLLPVKNEEKALGKMLPVADKLFDRVIILLADSADSSEEIASHYHCEIYHQRTLGKANAFREYFQEHSTGAVIAMVDADTTCDLSELALYAENCTSDAPVIMGNRFASGKPGVMGYFSYLVNKIVSSVVSLRVGKEIYDAQSPFWIFHHSIINILTDNLRATGFDLEVDMVITLMKRNIHIEQVPITYHHRVGSSKFSVLDRFIQIWKVNYHVFRSR